MATKPRINHTMELINIVPVESHAPAERLQSL
jgi:hypothetical protein